MIKCGDSTSDPDHCKDRSDSDAYQVMRKDETNRDCQTDIKKVETIFGKSYAFVDEIGDCLNNSISGIGDDTHVQRHGGTDACQNDGNDQKEDPSGKTSGKRIRISCPKIRDHTGKYIQEPGEMICSPYGRQWKYPKIYHMRSIFLCLGNSIVRS